MKVHYTLEAAVLEAFKTHESSLYWRGGEIENFQNGSR